MKALIDDAAAAVEAAPNGFVRGIVLLETRDGNFISITRGEDLEKAVEAATIAMGGEPLDEEEK
jgi:hypothetical protein